MNPEEVEQEHDDLKILQQQLLNTNALVKTLSAQLNELKERVSYINRTWHQQFAKKQASI